MKIGIVQVDGDLPNLALMQICGYHEKLGDTVEWWEGPLFNQRFDKIYASKIFGFSKLPQLPETAIIGGTGIDYKNVLPSEIASSLPSYTLYPDCNFHIGFSMKGCRYKCEFCCVPQKEGRPYFNSSISDLLLNPNGKNRLMLLDNDFFGIPNWEENLLEINRLKLKVCFAQGINIRILSERQAILLAKTNFFNTKFNKRYVTFAWDVFEDEKPVMRGIKRCNDAGIPCTKMQFFVLIGHKSTHEQNMERIMKLKNMGCLPFAMPYNKSDPYQKAFARWVNQRAVFNTCSWDEYIYNPTNLINWG